MAKIILVLCAFLVGCSVHYAKKGATQQDLSYDWTSCQAKAGEAQMAGNQDFLDNCMVGEGWKRK